MIGSVLSMAALSVVFVVALAWVPFNRWTFDHEGRRIEIRNYGLTESIRVDGQTVRGTRAGGDFVTHATHALPTLSGETLLIEVSTATFAVRCVARVGSRVVFDSLGDAIPVEPPILDPRWGAAQTLLGELDAHPDTARSAATLRRVLQKGFGALARSRELADAHRTLGGDAMRDVVAHHEQQVAEALELVRELHLASQRPRQSPEAASRSSTSTPRTSTMRSAERAQADKVSSTVVGNA